MATEAERRAFAGTLRAARQAKSMTQADLAQAISDKGGVSVTYQSIGQWERASATPARQFVVTTEKVLRLHPGSLCTLLGYAADADVQIAASGGDLDELRRVDPDAYAQLEEMARLHLDRAKARRRA